MSKTEKVVLMGQDEHGKTVPVVVEMEKQEPLTGEFYDLLAQCLYEQSKKESKIEGML